jgi:hypothetical protein
MHLTIDGGSSLFVSAGMKSSAENNQHHLGLSFDSLDAPRITLVAT